MRVLMVSAFPPWPMNDGNRLILHHHLRVLAPRHRITLIAAERHAGEPEPAGAIPRDVTFQWFGAGRAGLPEYARRRWRSVLSGEPADVFRVAVPGVVSAYEHALAGGSFDVVHLMGQGTAFLAARARAAGLPVVHMTIDAWSEAFGKHQLLPAWRRLIERGQARKVLRHERRHLGAADVVVVVAQRDADAVRRAAPAVRVEVVPNGVEVPAERVRPATVEPVIGIHGTMATLPNRTAAIAVATEVLPRVRRAVPGAQARIIGREPAPDVLRLQSKDVEVTGGVADVAGELARLAVYVVPMSEGSGIKNKVLEAMAHGLPVVCTPRALDGIGAGPGTVVGETADELAAAVIELLQDPDGARRCGDEGRQRVRDDFTWERSAGAIERLWREVARVDA